MNYRTLLGSAAVIILFLVIIALIVHRIGAPSPSSTATSTNPFDNLGGSSSGNPSQSSGSQLQVTAKDGTSYSVPDFTKQGQPAVASAQNGYQVAGSQEADYQILYFPDGSYFLVSLLSEPLGSVRLEAEQSLVKQLGLSAAQLCGLNVQVMTSGSVNPDYAGRNLGLSFCPGSVPLPN